MVIDNPVKFSTLLQSGKTKEEISNEIKERINELGRMTKNELHKIAAKIKTFKKK